MEIYNIKKNGDIEKTYNQTLTLNTSILIADSANNVTILPLDTLQNQLSTTYFINLKLFDSILNKVLSKNVYVWST